MFRQHPLLTLVTFAYLGLVGLLTLGPQPSVGGSGLIWELLDLFARHDATSWITYPVLEFSANVAMFVPIGLFFVLLFGRRRWLLAIVFGVLLTCGIEFAQLYIPGRVSDVRDLISNSFGAVIGVIAALVVTWPAAHRRRVQARTA